MTEEDFISQVWEGLIEENFATYRQLLETTDRGIVKDDYWKDLLGLYDSLDDKSKRIIERVIKQTFVDAMSNMLALLDGKQYLMQQTQDLVLSYDGEQLNGILMDLFLEKAELNNL